MMLMIEEQEEEVHFSAYKSVYIVVAWIGDDNDDRGAGGGGSFFCVQVCLHRRSLDRWMIMMIEEQEEEVHFSAYKSVYIVVAWIGYDVDDRGAGGGGSFFCVQVCLHRRSLDRWMIMMIEEQEEEFF